MSVQADRSAFDLGYRFWPKLHPQSAGHPRLDIKISSIPSERHFDPTAVHLLSFTTTDKFSPPSVEELKISHPWPFQPVYQVAPGMLIISDRKHKKVEAYSFGGTLKIHVRDEETQCVIESDAPIIEIEGIDATVMKLVEEVEIILAKNRAMWAQDEKAFEACLAKIPPSLLYAACLEELIQLIEHDHIRENAEVHELSNFIDAEKRRLKTQGLWPGEARPISEIVKMDSSSA